MSAMIDFRVMELLCSRLCHDLISPITAVNNGLELVDAEAGALDADIRDLLTGAAGTASKRLQFYRIAYGPGGPGGAPIGLSEAGRLAHGLTGDGKVTLQWPGAADEAGAALSRETVKLVLNMVLLAIESLPRGGTVALAIGAGPGLDATVTASGAGARIHAESAAAMADDADIAALTARSIQAYLVCRLAEGIGGSLSADAAAADTLTYRVAAA